MIKTNTNLKEKEKIECAEEKKIEKNKNVVKKRKIIYKETISPFITSISDFSHFSLSLKMQ